MRRKDWADEKAQEFYDLLESAEGNDDETIVSRIARSLREAYLEGLKEVAVTTQREDNGKKIHRYQVSVSIDTGYVPTPEYVKEHGKLTWLEFPAEAPEPNPDDLHQRAEDGTRVEPYFTTRDEYEEAVTELRAAIHSAESTSSLLKYSSNFDEDYKIVRMKIPRKLLQHMDRLAKKLDTMLEEFWHDVRKR